MRFALSLPNFGAFADVREVTAVAAAAEDGGWDGVVLWDHIAPSFEPGTTLPTADVTVALTAMALATHRIRIGPMVCPLPRRRPQRVARELASLDRLSGGRTVLGVPRDFEAAGATWWMQVVFAPADAHARAIAGPPRG